MTVQTTTQNTLQSKKHFEILDGLRGVAAIAIVLFHFMEVAYSDFSQNFIAHGFLAVDFFFCLSGFVIGYAYDDRIGKMGLTAFFKTRLIRLHPLVILGSVLGLLAFLYDPFGGHPELYSTGKIVIIFFSSILLIPYPVVDERFFNLFALNAPSWSLFWEYMANLVYAFILCRTGRNVIFLLTAIAAVAVFTVGYQKGSLLGGWDGSSFWDGFIRISYSFLAGLLVYRSNWIIKNKLGFSGLAILLLLAFIMPHSEWNWLTQPLVVLFYFPLLISLGAGAALSEGLKKICLFSGQISYPLYMTHYAVIWMFFNYYTTHKPGPAQLFWIISGGIILLITFAYLAMILYDIPVRNYLTRKFKKGQITLAAYEKTTIIHDNEYEIVSAYRDNTLLRHSFNDLTQQTYKFDFENWFNLGYWGENYIPYSLVKDNKIVANISVNIIDFDVHGNRKQYIQIGTVMTDRDHRNLGMSRFLMEFVLNEWESETDLIYLFANNTVLDFYPKFGFQSISEYEYTKSGPFGRTNTGVVQLDMSDATARQTLYDIVDKSVISAKLSMLNNPNLVLFYCTSFMRDQVFYIPDLHAIAIAEFETGICYLHDIFCREQISLDDVINSIVRSDTKKVVLGFAPADSSAYDIEILTTEPDTLFVKPGIAELFDRELLRFPVLSHA